MSILTEIRSIIEKRHCSNVLLAGDLNCHFERNNCYTNLVYDYLNDINLQLIWTLNDTRIERVDYTYHSINNGAVSYSVIDHFAVNESLFGKIESAGVIHSGENLSNHEAIFLKIKVGNVDPKLEKYPLQADFVGQKLMKNQKKNTRSFLSDS